MPQAWRWSRDDEAERPDADAPDAALVLAAQRDPRAFAPLYERYWDPVLRYCYYRLESWDAAADAAQQVLVDALGALPRFRDRDSSFRGWLFRIAHNEVADRHRRRARHPAAALTAAAALPDPDPSPEAHAVAADEHRRLRALLARLPDEQRRVTELRLAGLTGREIADVLCLSHDAVRKTQSRAIARLREAMTTGVSREGAPHA